MRTLLSKETLFLKKELQEILFTPETGFQHLKTMDYLVIVYQRSIDNAEDIDIVMPMYNFLQYSKNYRKTIGSLWNYYRDEPNNPRFFDDDDSPTIDYNADPITNSESFKYKSSITGKKSNANQGTERGNTKIKKILKFLFH